MINFFLIILSLFISYNASAQGDQVEQRKKHFNLEDALGIQGYDPVAYFIQNKALKGSKAFTATYLGIPYRFISEDNKNAFLINPQKYEPQYGGWCAYAMGLDGSKVKVDPKTFKIIDNQLYLFYNFFFNNTLNDWNKDEVNLKSKADTYWKTAFE
ncbi:MAG: YHS domain-containing (seleno)protein [Bacteroidota bacterium]